MRKVFLSAGHTNVAGKDRGAVSKDGKFIEGEIAVIVRDKIANRLIERGLKPTIDNNEMALSHTLNYFKTLTNPNSIVVDIHCNSFSETSSGVETLIPSNHTEFEKKLAEQISYAVHTYSKKQIPLRGNYNGSKGVKTEFESHHGKLGWMGLTGENVLIELFFISNPKETKIFMDEIDCISEGIADVIFDFAVRKEETNLYHIVVKGDTLYDIAKKYNTTIASIRFNNNLDGNIVYVGQRLLIR